MDPATFTSAAPGRVVKNLHGDWAFIPNFLPPAAAWHFAIADLLHDATYAVGKLEGTLIAHEGIDSSLLLRPLLQREAALSSRIEGTIANETHLSLFELRQKETEASSPDVREVSNYLAALEWAVAVGKERGITVTLIRQLHARLMDGVRGGDKTPGQFRDCQVYIGSHGSITNAKFVPPPYSEVPPLIDDLVKFIRDDKTYPPLLRIAIAHYQFETIHPFRDGNGRVGRLLIALQVMKDLDMAVPAIHLSPFFERDRRPYYDGLLAVSREGDWKSWAQYFLSGVGQQARDVMARLHRLRDLRTAYRERFGHFAGLMIMYRLIDLLFRRPAVDIATVVFELGVTKPSANKHVERLVEAGVLREITGKERGRVFLAEEILAIASRD